MNLLLLLLALGQAEPQFAGGVAPHPMSTPGPVDSRPSVLACSTETLRARSQCMLDGKPMWATDKAQQVLDNRRIASSIGESLCKEAAEGLAGESREKGERYRACLARVTQAARTCDLDGAEALLDAAGLFSTRAGACYHELAAAAQLVTAPAAPPEAPPAARRAVHGAGAEVRL